MAPSPSQAVASSPLFVGNPPGHRSVDGLGRSDAGHGERTRPRHHTLETGAGVDALGQPLSNFHVSPQHHVSSQHQDTTFTGDDPLHSITGVGMGPDADLRRMRRRGRQHDKSETPRLACPYYKMNPQRYHDCSGYVLRRVKDIKQHIYRRHMKPDIYCVRCYRPFSTEECKVKHSRGARACKVRDDPHAECISDRQRKNLHQYLSRGKPVEDQWIDMWKIIFPGRSPPRSVYLDNQQHGRAQLLRRLWSAQGPEIISQPVAPHLVEQIMNLFFARVEEEIHDADDYEPDAIPTEHSFAQQPQLEHHRGHVLDTTNSFTSADESPSTGKGSIKDLELDPIWGSELLFDPTLLVDDYPLDLDFLTGTGDHLTGSCSVNAPYQHA